jgi:tetratricopeptide (TPR) repeat protein
MKLTALSVLLAALLPAGTVLFAQGGGSVTAPVDRILAERDAASGPPVVGAAQREQAAARLRQGDNLRSAVRDEAWIVFALDSLRRSGVADSAAWFDLHERALASVQQAVAMTGGRYAGELSPAELGGLRETLRREAADKLLEALGFYEAALAANPWDDGVLAALAGVLEDLGRLYASLDFRERAIEATGKRLALDASNYFAHWDLADLLRDAGRGAAALDRYGKACRALRAFAWEDEGGSEERPAGRRREHLVLLLRERIALSMDLGEEADFRQALQEWEPLASQADQKEIGELKRWLSRAGGSLSQALRVDRAWKLIDSGREIEARQLLLEAVEQSAEPASRARSLLALADLEFYRLEMQELGLERVESLLAGGAPSDSLRRRAEDARAMMSLQLGARLEGEDPARAWNLYERALAAPGEWYPQLATRLGGLLLNRPAEALDWLRKAEQACRTADCSTADRREILLLQAEAQRRLDRPEEARRAWQAAQELQP